ncbi:MAG: hypothetical protein Fues2KO_15240 [Fuerstiella sp.]
MAQTTQIPAVEWCDTAEGGEDGTNGAVGESWHAVNDQATLDMAGRRRFASHHWPVLPPPSTEASAVG